MDLSNYRHSDTPITKVKGSAESADVPRRCQVNGCAHQPHFLNAAGASGVSYDSPYVALHSMRTPRMQPGLHHMKYESKLHK